MRLSATKIASVVVIPGTVGKNTFAPLVNGRVTQRSKDL